jgi:hypothetical protein
MDDSSKKATLALLNQIKSLAMALEDLVLNTACEIVPKYTKEPTKAPPARNERELSDEEEDSLAAMLERERAAIMQSDKALKDIWAQGNRQ